MKVGSIEHIEELYRRSYVLFEEYPYEKPEAYLYASFIFLEDGPYITLKGTRITKFQHLEFIKEVL